MKKFNYLFLLILIIPIIMLSGCANKEDQKTEAVGNSQPAEYIFNDIGIITGTFTVASTTDIASSTTNGLKDGDMIVLSTDNTLPTPLDNSTVYYVRDATTDSFRFSLSPNGAKINLTDDGVSTSTWTMHDIGKTIFVDDFRNAILAYDTDGGGDAAMTVKFQGSIQDTAPDFSAAQSVSNQWDYIQVIDLEDASAIDGDTGVAVAGADDHRLFEMNINHLRWVNAIISGYSEGELTLQIKLKDNQ